MATQTQPINIYLPGGHPDLKVGDHIVYRSRVGIIEEDYGYDYRFLVRFKDNSTVRLHGTSGARKVCGHPVRGMPGYMCLLDPGHNLGHSAVVFTCDGCGKTRRGQPHAWARDGEYEHGMAFCFLCAKGIT
jgi:hypothetical protein